MATIAERILEAVRHEPLDDDVLARRLDVRSRQSINQTARQLAQRGQLRRYVGPDGKILNARAESTGGQVEATPRPPAAVAGLIAEDEVKAAVRDHFEAQGYTVVVARGRTRGVDVEARHPDARRWLIEAKGEVASDQQQGNYFLGALGELVQRMDDPEARYALALPDNTRYRSLVDRLPRLARARLHLVILWVSRAGDGLRVQVEDPL